MTGPELIVGGGIVAGGVAGWLLRHLKNGDGRRSGGHDERVLVLLERIANAVDHLPVLQEMLRQHDERTRPALDAIGQLRSDMEARQRRGE